jgi:hypothetical protein
MTDMSVEPRSWMVYDPLLKTPPCMNIRPEPGDRPNSTASYKKTAIAGFIYEAGRWSITPGRLNASSIPFFDIAAPRRCRRQRL